MQVAGGALGRVGTDGRADDASRGGVSVVEVGRSIVRSRVVAMLNESVDMSMDSAS